MKDDPDKYINRRKKRDSHFTKNFERGYQELKVGGLLREARQRAGITQEDLARRTRTAKSAISRLENHSADVRLSTIERIAHALGKNVVIQLVKA